MIFTLVIIIDEGKFGEIHVGHLEKYNNFTINDIKESISWESKELSP